MIKFITYPQKHGSEGNDSNDDSEEPKKEQHPRTVNCLPEGHMGQDGS